ncbi:MAG TPA: prephenate dehydrogenase/arogenate dehydrogenase family protein [Burkholderiaceae bacterium]|nr:prephenate dehydrogenase/arogenate dehydrogenase family protein [Burkholderiaceae bacterium]
MTRLALIGAGLLGGSVAAALRAAAVVDHVTAYDHDPGALEQGLARGIVDVAAPSAVAAVAKADAVLLAVPVGAMAPVLHAIAEHVPAHALVFDVGSTKQSVIADARRELSAGSSFSIKRFVPCHPIAGGETAGIAQADAGLLRGRRVITPPVEETNPQALDTVEDWWRATGALVERMTPAEHDAVFAAVSHLPHLAAFALVDAIAASPGGADKLRLAGAGFRDFTRIAASNPAMWRDITLANREALGVELAALRQALADLQLLVEQGDAERLEALFTRASAVRRAMSGDAQMNDDAQ